MEGPELKSRDAPFANDFTFGYILFGSNLQGSWAKSDRRDHIATSASGMDGRLPDKKSYSKETVHRLDNI